ncbi:hypothetical protein [Oerskovia paurometabola]|uniref:DUF4760 domain-containing protein n=1 Tax=Oerskovia paurometabola TaxID=162170 RepID=A0ABW1X8A3_9CELL|nr:hypothetical protein [Oerskovia paurometabola]MBM7497824.1 hypothetical protein [Oerskovia paurometabola]
MDWSQMQFLLGALGGVVITGTVALVTSLLTRRAERIAREEGRRLSRADLRRSAYVAFLAQANGLGDEASAWHDTTGKHLAPDKLMSAFYRDLGRSSHDYDVCEVTAQLAAGPAVLKALDTYIAWYRAAIFQVLTGREPGLVGGTTKQDPLVEAMRAELDEDMSIPTKTTRQAKA